MKLPKLNLPEYKFRFKKSPKGEPLIFDTLRSKWLVLTPEEWVRQNLVTTLVKDQGYPKGLFKLETGVNVNGNPLRSDVVVFKGGNPYVLVECKAPNVKLSQVVLDQALNYNTQYNCPYIILSNGLSHVFLEVGNGTITQLNHFPSY